MAEVGTFSSPLRDVPPTPGDLPPGNGCGIHMFEVNRGTGALAPRGSVDLGTSSSCLAVKAAGTRLYSSNETDPVGDAKEGTGSAFAINRADGQFTVLNTVTSGGAGPTHVSVHPSGRLTPRQTISSLPPGYAGSNFCSEILVAADGRCVYTGKRLHDSIGIFAVGRTGELTFAGYEWTRGNYPRSFAFDPTPRFLYCCNQRADYVTVFRAGAKKDGPSFTGQNIPVGSPAHIVFVDLAKAE
jgi:6-phosphogluconolactonase (cycloisomerase 2 family)